jgi:hypothetical protein
MRHIAECERIWRRASEALAKHRKSVAESDVRAANVSEWPAEAELRPDSPNHSFPLTWDNETTPPRFALPGLCSTASPCTARASTT